MGNTIQKGILRGGIFGGAYLVECVVSATRADWENCDGEVYFVSRSQCSLSGSFYLDT